jgi:hypothetical protein
MEASNEVSDLDVRDVPNKPYKVLDLYSLIEQTLDVIDLSHASNTPKTLSLLCMQMEL